MAFSSLQSQQTAPDGRQDPQHGVPQVTFKSQLLCPKLQSWTHFCTFPLLVLSLRFWSITSSIRNGSAQVQIQAFLDLLGQNHFSSYTSTDLTPSLCLPYVCSSLHEGVSNRLWTPESRSSACLISASPQVWTILHTLSVLTHLYSVDGILNIYIFNFKLWLSLPNLFYSQTFVSSTPKMQINNWDYQIILGGT